MQELIKFLCEDLFDKRARNHRLIIGKPEDTLEILKAVYEKARTKEELLCTWHDASTITKPMDFFEPILRLKYGGYYEQLKEEEFFKSLVEKNEKSGVFQLASLCGKDENSKMPNAKKLPVFFIDGIEELLFKFDYDHLDEDGIKRLFSRDFMEKPLSKGFGDCLRRYLHQERDKAVFYGRVRNTQSLEFHATLGNHHYLFYCGNFAFLFTGDL